MVIKLEIVLVGLDDFFRIGKEVVRHAGKIRQGIEDR